MLSKKNMTPGKVKIFLFFIICQFINFNSYSETKIINEKFAEINILDKVSSKNITLTIEIEKETQFQNLIIKVMKCKNSEFDDNPEVTAYLQVKDMTYKDNNKVFVFNGWTFSSSPSLRPFDHPVYDIWLIKCY